MAGEAVRLAVAALAMVAACPVQAHCYSVWKYPSPQHCGVVGSPHVRVAVARVAAREDEPMPTPRPVEPLRSQPDILLPDIDSPLPTEPPPDEKDQILHALGIKMLKGQIGR